MEASRDQMFLLGICSRKFSNDRCLSWSALYWWNEMRFGSARPTNYGLHMV